MTDTHSFLERHADEIFRLPYALLNKATGNLYNRFLPPFENEEADPGQGFTNLGAESLFTTLLSWHNEATVIKGIRNINRNPPPYIKTYVTSPQILDGKDIAFIIDAVTSSWLQTVETKFPLAAQDIAKSKLPILKGMCQYLNLIQEKTLETDTPSMNLT